jgi:hypothetical protein
MSVAVVRDDTVGLGTVRVVDAEAAAGSEPDASELWPTPSWYQTNPVKNAAAKAR